MAIEKIKILVAALELPAKQHCQFSPFGPIFGVNMLVWHCCLAGSSKMGPRILIFSIAICADCSKEVKNNKILAPVFFKHNNLFMVTVQLRLWNLMPRRLYWQSKDSTIRLSQSKYHKHSQNSKILGNHLIPNFLIWIRCR